MFISQSDTGAIRTILANKVSESVSQQAVELAEKRAERDGGFAIVQEYEFDGSLLNDSAIKVKHLVHQEFEVIPFLRSMISVSKTNLKALSHFKGDE